MKNSPKPSNQKTEIKDESDGKFMEHFNNLYDFLSRIVKALIFISIVGLIIWKLPLINWEKTSDNIIAQKTPIALGSQSTLEEDKNMQPATVPASTNGTSNSKNLISKARHRISAAVSRKHLPNFRATSTIPKSDTIYQNEKPALIADHPYDVSGKYVVFNKLIVKNKPDYYKPFIYAGVKLKILRIAKRIGLLITKNSAVGPVLEGVACEIQHNSQ